MSSGGAEPARRRAVAKRRDPGKQFVREATIGLVVVACLLALIVHGLTRRFGVLDAPARPRTVEAAKVFTRLPKPASGNAGGTAVADRSSEATRTAPRTVDGPSTRTDPIRPASLPSSNESPGGAFRPGNAVRLAAADEARTDHPSNPRSASAIPVTAAGEHDNPAAATATSPRSPRRESPAAELGPPSGETNVRERTDGNAPTHDSAPVAPQSPFRAVPSASGTAAPGASRSERRGPAVDPRWTIRLDDSAWNYCDRNYGDPQWFRALEAWLARDGRSFTKLIPGERLQPPTTAQLRQVAPDLAPEDQTAAAGSGRVVASRGPAAGADAGGYIASGSESLFDIAGRVLGQAGRYLEIVELESNASLREFDPLAPLPAGTRVDLPLRR